MEALKNKILREGEAIGTEIVKVDGFLNHQIDVAFVEELGREFKARFVGEEVTKVLTVEASGILVAAMAAKEFGYVPLVFAKKMAPSTMNGEFYGADVRSFTKGTVSNIRVAKKYLNSGDRVLIIDDFLAHGEALNGLISLVDQAGGKLAGAGIVIEKRFQKGGDAIRAKGVRIESLAAIERMRPGEVVFAVDGQGGKAE